MLDPPTAFREIAEEYVCVRVTDVQSLDLDLFRFDFDLTLAALLMHADGTIYHRFGGRERESATAWSSVEALVRVMRETLPEHAARGKGDTAVESGEARTVWDFPTFAERVKRADTDCIHCHTLHDAERNQARAEGKFNRQRDLWVWPSPARIGLTLDSIDQALVNAVVADSAAARAGLRAGDRLWKAGEQRLLTIHDVQFVLNEAGWGPVQLALDFRRDEVEARATLELAEGWKISSPLEYSWRASKWDLDPRPGFGGPALNAEEKRALEIDIDAFAYRVQYLVTWGKNRASGKNAARAGIRVGDVIISIDGKSDFESADHVHAWYRLTRKGGGTVEFRLLRDGEQRTVSLPLL